MSLVLRAQVALMEGCKLLYDCPALSTEDYRANEFFKKYRGKRAEFVGYVEKLVGVLDHKGRMPGRYIDLEWIKVRFDGEEEVQTLNLYHFVVIDPTRSRVSYFAGDNQRVGDLPNPILFYPGDTVCYKGLAGEQMGKDPRKIGSVFLGTHFTKVEGVPQYDVMETDAEKNARQKSRLSPLGYISQRQGSNTPGDMLELVSRGNVWALYNDSSKLSFESDKDELEFWSLNGISKSIVSQSLFKEAYELFVDGEVDLLRVHRFKNRGTDDLFDSRKLHACFAEHRQRVRDLTQRLYPEGIQAELSL